jgi:hypothetical protein
LRFSLLGVISLVASAQFAQLTLPTYDMFRYAVAGRAFSYRFAPAGALRRMFFRWRRGQRRRRDYG